MNSIVNVQIRNIFTSVCLSTGGAGGALSREISVQGVLCPEGVSVQRVSLSRGGLCPEGVSVPETLSFGWKERAVRILLECILVIFIKSFSWWIKLMKIFLICTMFGNCMLFASFPCTFRTQDPLLQQVWSRVNPDTGYLKSSKQGAATAREGNFAFICEEPFGDYLATLPPCDLRTIQSFLITDNARTYNFAAQKREDLKQNITAINKVIERMSNNYELQNLYDKSFKGGACAGCVFSLSASLLLSCLLFALSKIL